MLKMNIKQGIKKYIFIFLIPLVACDDIYKSTTPYAVGLQNISSEGYIFRKILYNKSLSNKLGSMINVYAYLNKENSTLYASKDIVKDPDHVQKLFDIIGIKLYENYEQKVPFIKLDKCKANQSLVEIIGILEFDNNTETYYLDKVQVIYDFNTMPGGKGEKILCFLKPDIEK